MTPRRNFRLVRFGSFTVDLERRHVRKYGVRVKVQTQPFQILEALLEKPGAIVTRNELRRRLWPDNTFVDFEHGLNAAVARLRQSLGDSSEEPRYIETLAKVGYRFAWKVEEDTIDEHDAISKEETPAHPAGPGSASRFPTALWITTAVALVAAGGALVSFVSIRELAKKAHPTLLTSFRGFEGNPALSPDGKHVAFTWNGEKQDNFDIYAAPVAPGTPVRLTTDASDDLSPSWSPDGRTIAFLRQNGDRSDLMVVPATGGPEHKIAETQERMWFQPRKSSSLAWSPDGRWIAATHRESGESTDGIYLFSLTGEKRRLTTPPSDFRSDNMPSLSPDGRTLAFCRLPGAFVSDIYVLPLDADLRPLGEARRLTHDKKWSAHPVWTADGRNLLYVFGNDGSRARELRIIDVARPQRLPQTIPLSDEVSEISLGGRHLVYSRQVEDTNIWRAELPRRRGAPARAELFITSTQPDQTPQYSPDGKKIAFASARSGSREIWVSNADASNPVQMTFFGAPVVGCPSWSPDGRSIAFHARPAERVDVFAISAAGGSAKRVAANSWAPTYSGDGQALYCSSKLSGEAEIWKMPAPGGDAVQLTTTRWAEQPIASHDGKLVYFLRQDRSEIWSVPALGGQPVRVTGPTHRYPVGFAVTSKGIYYGAPPHAGEDRFIRFFEFSTGESRPVVVAKWPFHVGMSVSPDSRYILFDQYDELGSDLMIIEDFAQRK